MIADCGPGLVRADASTPAPDASTASPTLRQWEIRCQRNFHSRVSKSCFPVGRVPYTECYTSLPAALLTKAARTFMGSVMVASRINLMVVYTCQTRLRI